MRCVTCGRTLRRREDRKEDYPGTVILIARGMCSTCYDKFRLGADTRVHIRGNVGKSVEHLPGVGDVPCVLVRVDLTPNTYKAFRKAGVDIGPLLSQAADQIVEGWAPRA